MDLLYTSLNPSHEPHKPPFAAMRSIFHEGGEASVASSSPVSSSRWPPPVSSSSWSFQWQQRPPPPLPLPLPPPPCGMSISDNTNYSFTTTGGHSTASVDDSSADLLREAVAENHLWNQVLFDDGHGVFDYSKKMDGGDWELNLNPNSSLSWFISPPVPCHDRRRQRMVGSDKKLASTSICKFHESNAPPSVSDGVPFDRCSNAKRSPAELQSMVSSSEKGSESSTVRNGEGKKKRSKETAETLNESKCGQKMKVPKAKIAEKINALQQLVSPFGKTDQASVLMETITYIRILQEQVQLLSDPYLKSNAIKNSRGGEMKMKVESEMHELRSKGLCLVPVSSIARLERDSNALEFWMPSFHSCLY